MIKQKPKNWRKKVLLTAVAAFIISLAMPAFSVSALTAQDCPQGWTFENNSCTNPDPNTTCPPGLINGASSTTQKICIETPGSETTGSSVPLDTGDTENRITSILQLQGFMNKLIWPVLVMIGGLMDNTLLFGNGMEERLRAIWVPIRNIVNILFVIVLVGVALYNVLGLGDNEGNYSIKSILPKLIIGIIAVNFSFLGIKVFLDGINVLTTSIFSLPGQINEGLNRIVDPNSSEYDAQLVNRFCKTIQGKSANSFIQDDAVLNAEIDALITQRVAQDFNLPINASDNIATIEQKIAASDQSTQINAEIQSRKEGKLCNGITLSEQGEIFLSTYNSRNAALAMALGLSKIVFYSDIPQGTANISDLAINVIFSAILYLIYLTAFLALFVVLLARLVVMWISVAVAPILLLGISVPAVKEKIPGFDDLTSTFMKNAIAPVGIAIAMSIGWIMLKAINSITTPDTASTIILSGGGIPVVGLSSLQDIVVALGTVGVIWMAVFAAAGESIAAPVTNFLKEGLASIGKFAVTTPLRNIPLFQTQIGTASVDVTPGQIMELSRRIGANQSARDGKLAELLQIGGRPRIEEIADKSKVTNASQLASYIQAHRDAFKDGDAQAQKAVQQFIRNNDEVFESLRGIENGTLQKNLKAFSEAKDETQAKELGKAILGSNFVQQAPPAELSVAGNLLPSGKAPVVIDNTTIFAGKELGDKAESVKDIVSEIKRQAPLENNKADLKESIEKLKTTAGSTPSKDDLENVLGTDTFKQVQKSLGNELDTLTTPAAPASEPPASP